MAGDTRNRRRRRPLPAGARSASQSEAGGQGGETHLVPHQVRPKTEALRLLEVATVHHAEGAGVFIGPEPQLPALALAHSEGLHHPARVTRGGRGGMLCLPSLAGSSPPSQMKCSTLGMSAKRESVPSSARKENRRERPSRSSVMASWRAGGRALFEQESASGVKTRRAVGWTTPRDMGYGGPA